MAEVLLFHHAFGRTPGVLAFAEELRQSGHTVHVPDLYAGRTFDDLDAGVSHAQQVGFDTIIERGVRAAEALPNELVLCRLFPRRDACSEARPDTAGRQAGSAIQRVRAFRRLWRPVASRGRGVSATVVDSNPAPYCAGLQRIELLALDPSEAQPGYERQRSPCHGSPGCWAITRVCVHGRENSR